MQEMEPHRRPQMNWAQTSLPPVPRFSCVCEASEFVATKSSPSDMCDRTKCDFAPARYVQKPWHSWHWQCDEAFRTKVSCSWWQQSS